MRVVHVSLRFDAPGGVETNVRQVARGLAIAGDDVRVFASDLYDEDRWERRNDFPPTVDGVPVSRYAVYKRLVPGLTMPMWTGLIPALADSGADVIHAHSHRYGHVLQSAAVARRTGIPLVVSTHYHPADRREPAIQRGLLRAQDHLFGMTAYRIAQALVVETTIEAGLVAQFAPRNRIRVIPPGVDLGEWSDPGHDLAPAGLPERFVLYAGRVASNKGLATLIEAIARLPAPDRPDVVLLGRDWGEKARLESLAAARGVGDRVHFLGHLFDRGQYRAVFRRAAAFVLPSEWEAYGLVLLEAMAAGRPIVASSVGGIPEVLEGGRAGRLVRYGDPEDLATAIRAVLTDPRSAEDLVAHASRRVQELTWARCVERHQALYRELAG